MIAQRKPDSTADDIVLGDFGCCIGNTTPTALHRGVAGSAGYLAPEMSAWPLCVCADYLLTLAQSRANRIICPHILFSFAGLT